jgi:NTP pyrophosphatase (non-canonical NTP hydrolase)
LDGEQSLSLTLRDAQYLSWKTFKKLGATGEKRSTTSKTPEDLIKKACETAGKMRTLKEFSSCPADKETLEKLLSELLFETFILAEQNGVDLEKSFMQTMDEYILGFVQ